VIKLKKNFTLPLEGGLIHFFLEHTSHFQWAFYQPSHVLIEMKMMPVFVRRFKLVIDISMETINAKKGEIGKA